MEATNVVLQEESNASGVSWGAVLAGAFVAAAISLILVVLGAGLGFTAVSPWAHEGVSAATLGLASILWLALMQIISGSLGGYIAGRLRTKWVNVHTDEVFFRDTAHGFLVWAVGLVITAAFLTSAVTTLLGAGAKAGTAVMAAGISASGVAASAAGDRLSQGEGGPSAYFIDSLFRSSETSDAAADDDRVRAEVGRIFSANSNREFAAADRTYLAQLVAARTGITQAEAETRVSEVISRIQAAETQARQAADTARKAAAKTALWIFVSLLIGAFFSSYAATIGGRLRDDYKVI